MVKKLSNRSMGDISNAEGVSVSAKGSENGHGRWDWLRNARNLFRRPNSNHHEQASEPTKQQEVSKVVPGTGYMSLIADFQADPKEGSNFLAQILEKEYTDLISTVTLDASTSQEAKKVLVDEINAGNREVIAVVAARLFANMGGDVKLRSRTLRKNTILKDKLPKIKYLAGVTEKYFIEQESARDSSQQPQVIKEDWARSKFFQAVSNPNWQPRQQASTLSPYENAFSEATPGTLDPNAPLTTQPPQR